MDTIIPLPDEVKARLEGLTHAQMTSLSKLSGVPFTTLWKVRSGETKNPGIGTVAQFLPHVAEAARGLAPVSAAA